MEQAFNSRFEQQNEEWRRTFEQHRAEINDRNKEIAQCKSDHTNRMQQALADYAKWKQELEAAHSAKVKQLEADLAQSRAKNTKDVADLTKTLE